jgi:hypothetical protein
MANKLTDELQSLVQRSGTNTGRMRTEAERASFSANVRKDLASIVYQLNVVYYELVKTLSSEVGANALDLGLAGNTVFTHVTATEADAEAYYSADQARARTIKETIDVLLSEIARLENELQAALDSDDYDDAELRGLIQGNSLDLLQLARDSMGPNYTLDGDGEPDLTYSLSQAIDAIGAFFSGFPGTGNSYSASYPTMSLTVLLSQVTIDTTLPQSTITGLAADLGYIRTFIGMDTSGPETPTYTDWSANVFITNGWSLERAIAELDTQLGAHASRHESAGADELDGDHLDIDYVPANYTRTTVPIANVVDHLTAHLKGIDDALAGIATVTLQDTYDAGAAGAAGVVQLLNSQGNIVIKDDAGSPLATLLEWRDQANALIGTLRDTGIELQADRSLAMKQSTVDPTAVIGEGRLNTRPDATSADTELHYRSSNSGNPNVQITRDGIVKELEVGHTVVYPGQFQVFAAGNKPALVVEEMTDFVVQTLDFDPTTQETCYTSVPIPQDEQGDRPARVKFVGHFLMKPNGGGYPGGTGMAFEIAISDNVGNGTIGNKALIDPGWQTPLVQFDNTLGAGQVDNLVVLEFSVQTLATNPLGILNIKLRRDPANANDSWDDDVGLVALHVIWYR